MKIKNITIYIISLIFSHLQLSASDIIQVNDHMFQIDHCKKLILINQKTSIINAQLDTVTTSLRLDKIYKLDCTVPEFKVGVKYILLNPQLTEYTLYFTTLPVINITSKHKISDIALSPAIIELAENSGLYSKLSALINYRGAWTSNLPKKSFRLHFVKDTICHEKQNVRLLGLRKDDDWNLQAMANEPLKLRGKVNNTIWSKIHRLAYHDKEPEAKSYVDMKYTELFVNGEYRGLYALSERIDRKQLKLSEEDGGELYKAKERDLATMFTGTPEFDNSIPTWSGFFCEYPDSNWNWESLSEAVDFVINTDNHTFYEDYESVFEINNSIDYLIFINLLTAVDNTHKNIYYARYNSSSPLTIVPWDLDCTMGLNWDGTLRNNINDLVFTKYLVRLVFNFGINGYTEKIQKRWKELRLNTITSELIMNLYKDSYNQLQSEGVYEREEIAWSDYHFDSEHFDYIADWLERRLKFLDGFFDNPIPYLMGSIDYGDGINNSEIDLRINSDEITLEIVSKNPIGNSTIKIYNYSGELALSRILKNDIESIDISQLTTGTYLVIIDNKKSLFTRKILINR